MIKIDVRSEKSSGTCKMRLDGFGYLDKTPEPERPAKVIVAILTDGLENASQEFKRKEIFKMIKRL